MNKPTVIFLSLILAGCAQVKQIQNLDPLLTLKSYSDEKEEQEKWVSLEEKKFEVLLTAVSSKSIDQASTDDSVLQSFGEPVLVDHIKENDIVIDRWLYRHPIQKLSRQRVYFYFNPDGRLIRYEQVVTPLNEQSKSE